MSIIRYLGIFALAGIVVIGISLLWSKFTTRSRPESLGAVREEVLKTQTGQDLANMLGVSDDSQKPINVPALSASIASSMSNAVTQKAQEVVTTQIIERLSKQYDGLPDNQKQELREFICKP